MYELNMSKGSNIRIDEEDLKKIRENISANLIQVKQAIINPSFLISIVPIEEKEVITKPIFEIKDGIARQVSIETTKRLQNKLSTT